MAKKASRPAGKRRMARTRNAGEGGTFPKGPCSRRNIHGQRNKAAVQATKLFRDVLVAIGNENLTVELKEINRKVTKKKIEWLGQKVYSEALSGNMTAVVIILDRTEGKVTQPISGDMKVSGQVLFIMPRPGKANG
jgi:hypothetical protein